jgi:ComF family protein
MGSRLSAANTGGFGDAELVPVPLHPQKKILRGYNQSELIADGIASTTGMPVNNLALFREVNKTSQTRKSRSERWEEIQHDFIAESNVVKGKNLILVDDVCTTGATVEACALTLLNAGASSVGLLTLAFASDFFV